MADQFVDADTELIERSLKGEAVAFRDLYRKHEQRVRSMLWSFAGCGLDIDDHVQEVFIRAWKNLSGFRRDSLFSTWLFRIAQNVAADNRKSYALQSSRHVAFEATAEIPDLPKRASYEVREMIGKMLSSLEFNQQQIIVLVDLEGFSLHEASEILNIPIGTIKSRLHYARQEARCFLKKEGVHL